MIHCSAIKMSFILIWLSFLLSFEHAFWVSSVLCSSLFFHLAEFHHFSTFNMNDDKVIPYLLRQEFSFYARSSRLDMYMYFLFRKTTIQNESLYKKKDFKDIIM